MKKSLSKASKNKTRKFEHSSLFPILHRTQHQQGNHKPESPALTLIVVFLSHTHTLSLPPQHSQISVRYFPKFWFLSRTTPFFFLSLDITTLIYLAPVFVPDSARGLICRIKRLTCKLVTFTWYTDSIYKKHKRAYKSKPFVEYHIWTYEVKGQIPPPKKVFQLH